MPYLSITTNVALSPEAEAAWTADASKALAAKLGKPEAYVMVALQKTSAARFGGTDAPAVFMDLMSIGLPRDCVDLAQALTAIAARNGVATSRVYLACTDVPAPRWAHGGEPFA